MEVTPDINGRPFIGFADKRIMPGTTISSDAYHSYRPLAGAGFKHEYQTPAHLHWLHTIFSNVKAFVNRTFHGEDSKHLQTYLDEFCYRFNR